MRKNYLKIKLKKLFLEDPIKVRVMFQELMLCLVAEIKI